MLAATGAGKASTALAAGFLLAREPWAALIDIGCAGAFPNLFVAPGEVVIADREILADEGTDTPEGFLDLEALRLPVAVLDRPVFNEIPIHPACRLSPKDLARFSEEIGFPVRAGPLCTVSTASGTDLRAAEVFARTRALAESMEGAAAALAALRFSLPFLEIRGISNLTGRRDRTSWDIPRAIQRSTAVLHKLLDASDRWVSPAESRLP